MKILGHKDAINRCLYEGIIIVETAIYRVCYLNRTVLGVIGFWILDFSFNPELKLRC
ncbi:hypothetical protein H6G93_09625 [Nostoc sp. FACHB-973]|nr:hypothetical protein [Nostoc sp. FACHB-973]MBX9257840.1 hypothetical protein [Desmonostoc muscorum CCALA 125]